jgi:hypothetical protein
MLRALMNASRDTEDVRWAKLANVLAEAARQGRIDEKDARTVLVQALRVRNNNTKLEIRPRSSGAQASIERHSPNKPTYMSPDELQADHVYAFPHTGAQLSAYFARVTSVEVWLEELHQLDQVVCLTAAENRAVSLVESEVTGPEKYKLAGITFVDPTPWGDPATKPSRTEPFSDE